MLGRLRQSPTGIGSQANPPLALHVGAFARIAPRQLMSPKVAARERRSSGSAVVAHQPSSRIRPNRTSSNKQAERNIPAISPA